MNIEVIVLSVAGFSISTVVGCVAYELHQLRSDVILRVHKEDCKEDMGAHCKRLENVERQCHENGKSIAVISNSLGV